MKTVWEIIQLFGGLDALKKKYIRIENRGYMPLVIEYVGEGPRGLPLVSVAHTYVQEGDLMYDPEMGFEIDPQTPNKEWEPITYVQHNLGINQVAVWREDNNVLFHPKLVRDLKSFARTWNKNLREQGFIDAARAALQGVSR